MEQKVAEFRRIYWTGVEMASERRAKTGWLNRCSSRTYACSGERAAFIPVLSSRKQGLETGGHAWIGEVRHAWRYPGNSRRRRPQSYWDKVSPFPVKWALKLQFSLKKWWHFLLLSFGLWFLPKMKNSLEGKFSFLSLLMNVLRQEVEIHTIARLPSKVLRLRAAWSYYKGLQGREKESSITISRLAHGVEQPTQRTCSPVSILAFSFTGSFSYMIWHIKLKQ